MFAGNGATGGNARLHDGAHGVVHTRAFVSVVRVVRNVGVQVAVAGVEHVAHGHIVLLPDRINGRENLGELRARYHGVLHYQRGRQSSHGAEGFLASLPEPRAVGFAGGHRHAARTTGQAGLANDGDVFVEAVGHAVYLAQ